MSSPRVVVNTFYTPSYAPLAAIIIPNLISYCKKHGYHYMINETKDDEFHFIKTRDTRKLLDVFGVVFTIELDALITNHNIKVEDFLDDTHDIYITTDRNGVNFGAFIAKSTQYTKDLLDEINDNKNNYGDEQNFMESYHHPKCKVVNHPCFNSIPYKYYEPSLGVIGYKDGDAVTMPTHEGGNWEPADFVCHTPGMSLMRRIEIFQELQKQIIL